MSASDSSQERPPSKTLTRAQLNREERANENKRCAQRKIEEESQRKKICLVPAAAAVGSVDLPSSDVVTPRASTPRASTPRASTTPKASTPKASASRAHASSMSVPTNAVVKQAAVTQEAEESSSRRKTRS